jgi:hypothetical protein
MSVVVVVVVVVSIKDLLATVMKMLVCLPD